MPAAATAARYAGQAHVPHRGWEPVPIPGAVSGWAALSQRFGALPFADRIVHIEDGLIVREERPAKRVTVKSDAGGSPSPEPAPASTG